MFGGTEGNNVLLGLGGKAPSMAGSAKPRWKAVPATAPSWSIISAMGSTKPQAGVSTWCRPAWSATCSATTSRNSPTLAAVSPVPTTRWPTPSPAVPGTTR